MAKLKVTRFILIDARQRAFLVQVETYLDGTAPEFDLRLPDGITRIRDDQERIALQALMYRHYNQEPMTPGYMYEIKGPYAGPTMDGVEL